MFWKGKKLLKRHRIILWITLIAISLLGLSTYLTNSHTTQQVKTHYLQAFEKKYWAELDTFHSGNLAIAKNYFNTTFTAVTNLSRQEHVVRAVASNNNGELATYIDQARSVTGLIELLFVLDDQGTMIAESSEDGSLKQHMGASFAERPYFQEAIKTRLPVASKVFLTKNGYYGYNFCSPVMSENNLAALICGGGRLSGLADRLRAAKIKSDHVEFRALISDTEGTVLFEDGEKIDKPRNIKDTNAVKALMAGAESYKDEEITASGEGFFVEAGRIDLGAKGGVFVLSYLPKSESEKELALLESTLVRINTGNGFRALLLTLFACAVVYLVIRKHDEETTTK